MTNTPGQETFHADAIEMLKAVSAFAAIDKAQIQKFTQGSVDRIPPQELDRLYRTNNFLANVVDTLPNASIQKGWEYKLPGFEEKDNPVEQELKRAMPYVCKSCKQARKNGWSLVGMLLNDGGDLSEPVNERNLQGFKQFNGYSVWQGGMQGDVTVHEWQNNKLLPDYGMPLFYNVDNQIVHESRVMLFTGVERLSPQAWQTDVSNDPGTSVIERCHQEWKNFTASNNAIAATMPSFNQKILKIKDLYMLLAKEKEFQSYISGISLAMNILGMMLVDADGGDYDILAHNYSGVPDLLEHFKKIFAGSTDIMATDLFNESPSGVTSGTYEQKHRANAVHAYQTMQLAPQLQKLIRYSCLMHGIDPSKGKLQFPSLYELDAKDEADVNLKKAQALRALVGGGQVVLPEEAAKSLAEGVEIGKAIDLTKERAKPQPILMPAQNGKPVEKPPVLS